MNGIIHRKDNSLQSIEIKNLFYVPSPDVKYVSFGKSKKLNAFIV